MLDGDKYNTLLKDTYSCDCALTPKILQPFKHANSMCMFKNKREVKYRQGETIIKQDTNLTHVACLKSGIVKQYIETENGKNIIYNILSGGDMIGFSEILTDKPINFSVTAITETTTCLIPVENALEVMSKNPSMAMDIMKYNNQNHQKAINTFVNLNQKNMYQKVSSLLLYFSRDLFESKEFCVPICRQDLADMCSMTKESFIRVLKEFKESGYISVRSNDIKIIDPTALEKMTL